MVSKGSSLELVAMGLLAALIMVLAVPLFTGIEQASIARSSDVEELNNNP